MRLGEEKRYKEEEDRRNHGQKYNEETTGQKYSNFNQIHF